MVERVHLRAGCVAVARRAGGARSLINIFTVDIDGIGPKGRTSVTAAGVALFEPEELNLGLESFEEGGGHGVGLIETGMSRKESGRKGKAKRV